MNPMKDIERPCSSSLKRNTVSRRKSSRKSITGEQAWKKSRTTANMSSPQSDLSSSVGKGNVTLQDVSKAGSPTMKRPDAVCTSQLEEAELRQSGQTTDQVHRGSITSNRGTSIFFDPVNPTISLFQGSSKDSWSAYVGNMNHVPGIHIPRVKTPPPERRWPPQKRENWKWNLQNDHHARQAVPAKLKVPKPLPRVKYPEFFEIGAVSQKSCRSAAMATADRRHNVLRTGNNARGIPHEYSEIIEDPDDFSLNMPVKSPALDTSVKLPENAAHIQHGHHVTDVLKKLVDQRSNSQGLTNNAGLHGENAPDQNVRRVPSHVNTGLLLHTQFAGLSEVQPNKVSPGQRDLLQGNIKSILDYPVAANTEAILGKSAERREFLGESAEDVGHGEEMQVSQAELIEDTTEIHKSRALPIQPVCQKPFGEKDKSPRRIADMDFAKENTRTQTPSTSARKSISAEKNFIDQPTSNQNDPSIYGPTLVSRRLFPRRQVGELGVDPAGKPSKRDRVPIEVVSEGIFSIGNEGAPSGNRIYSTNAVADDFKIWNSMSLSDSSILTKSEEETVESIFCDLDGTKCEEAPDFEKIAKVFVDPTGFEWMRNGEKTATVPGAIPSFPVDIFSPAAEEQVQTEDLHVQQQLVSKKEHEDTPAQYQPVRGRQAMKNAHSHGDETIALTGVLSPGFAKKRVPHLMCPKCPMVHSSRAALICHLSRAHRHVPSTNCHYCKDCFSCLCEPSIRQTHHASCQKHKALNACFHCKFMFPSQKHCLDHILQKHTPLSIPCCRSNSRIISQTETSQGTKAGKKDNQY